MGWSMERQAFLEPASQRASAEVLSYNENETFFFLNQYRSFGSSRMLM